jgi:hypothetical protein
VAWAAAARRHVAIDGSIPALLGPETPDRPVETRGPTDNVITVIPV